MGRAEVRFNDGEVMREADERWRERRRERGRTKRCHISFMLRGLEEKQTWKHKELAEVCLFVCVCML